MDFPAPAARKETNTELPVFMDGLFEKTKSGPMGLHQMSITFPNKPCANCMLQVIQIMKVDPPYDTTAGSDVYYQCADIVLEGEPMGGGGTDAGAPGGGADAGAGSGGSSGAGGSAATGGSSGTGGSTTGTGGSSNSGGSTGSGGSSASGGSGSAGSSGGSGGSTGSSSGGASGSRGGSTGSGGSAPSTPPDSPPASCTMGSDRQPISGLAFVALIGVAFFLRRRRA
jgi:hypothetical protein